MPSAWLCLQCIPFLSSILVSLFLLSSHFGPASLFLLLALPAAIITSMALYLPPLGSGSSSTGGAHTQPSLPSLPAHLQSDTHITAHLASRFHVSLPTARLSSHAIISLNTYTSSTKGIDGGKEGSALAGAEDLADRTFLRLGHRSENQAVLFL